MRSKDSFLKLCEGGVELTVRVSPGSAREGFGVCVSLGEREGEALAVALRAPPVDGKANEALVAYLAKSLGVRKSAVSILTGQSSRIKRVAIAGDVAALRDKILEKIKK